MIFWIYQWKYVNKNTEKIQFEIFYSKFAKDDNISNDIKKIKQDCIQWINDKHSDLFIVNIAQNLWQII